MNRSILALCAWLAIALVVLVAAAGTETVCIAAQSLTVDGEHLIDGARCLEVAP